MAANPLHFLRPPTPLNAYNRFSNEASSGARDNSALRYLNALYNYYNDKIPLLVGERAYRFVVENTIRDSSQAVRGPGDLFLQLTLVRLKYEICVESAPASQCWNAVLRHTEAVRNGIVGLDDQRLSRLHIVRARALWELALLSIGLEREKLISASLAEVVIAAGHNNKGGAAGDVLFMFVQLMDRTLDGTIDFDRVLQGIALPLRAECFQHGHSYR